VSDVWVRRVSSIVRSGATTGIPSVVHASGVRPSPAVVGLPASAANGTAHRAAHFGALPRPAVSAFPPELLPPEFATIPAATTIAYWTDRIETFLADFYRVRESVRPELQEQLLAVVDATDEMIAPMFKDLSARVLPWYEQWMRAAELLQAAVLETRQTDPSLHAELAAVSLATIPAEFWLDQCQHDVLNFEHRIVLQSSYLLGDSTRCNVLRETMRGLADRLSDQPLNVFASLTEVVRSFSAALCASGGTVKADAILRQLRAGGSAYDVDAAREVAADLTAIFQNLIGNAIKYPKPGESPRVFIDATLNDEDAVEFLCHDEGAGFPQELIDRILSGDEPVRGTVRDAAGNLIEGTGTGWQVIKEICRRRGWKIRIGSPPGHGSDILLRIPQTDILATASVAAHRLRGFP